MLQEREQFESAEVCTPNDKRAKLGFRVSASLHGRTHSKEWIAEADLAKRLNDLIWRAGSGSGLPESLLFASPSTGESPCSCCEKCGEEACFLERCQPCGRTCVLREGHKGHHWCENHVEEWKRVNDWGADASARGPGGRRFGAQTPWVREVREEDYGGMPRGMGGETTLE